MTAVGRWALWMQTQGQWNWEPYFVKQQPWARRSLWHWWINWASIRLSHEHFGFYMKQMSPLCQNEQSNIVDAFSNYQLNHHIKLIHLGIRPLLSYWKPVEPHGVGLRAQVPEAARLSSRAAVWPGLTLQLCAPQFGQTTTWTQRFLPAQRDVLSNYNNITIMSFPFTILALSHFQQGHSSF